MNQTEKLLLSFTAIREQQKKHLLRSSEVPVESAVSMAMPTMRWGEPSYAFFAAPALRRPDAPLEQGSPDRWWVIAAHGGSVLVYALCKAIAFPGGGSFGPVTLPPVAATRAEQRQTGQRIDELMDELVPNFFAGQAVDPASRQALLQALAGYLPQPLLPQYRGLAPDFFAWLEA